MIVALAGRRIDAPDAAAPRFPLANIATVVERIRIEMVKREVTDLVCAAACGADLLALQVAGELGVRRRVVLPFAPARFRDMSVIDRPGEWGPFFDTVIREVESTGDLVVLEDDEDDEAAFVAANSAILDEALALAHSQMPERGGESPQRQSAEKRVLAVIVWDGKSRGESDVTTAFAREARTRGLEVVEVPTL